MNIEQSHEEDTTKESSATNQDRDTVPPEESQAEIESEQIANQKLTILMDENFRDFAVRFVDVKEYEAMLLSSDVTPSRESFVFRTKRTNVYEGSPQLLGMAAVRVPTDVPNPSFSEYLKSGAGRWSGTIEQQTDWQRANYNIHSNQDFIRMLKDSHNEAKNEGVGESLRKRVMTVLASKLSGLCYSNPETSFQYEDMNIQSESLESGFVQHLESSIGKEILTLVIQTIYRVAGEYCRNHPINPELGFYESIESKQAFLRDQKKGLMNSISSELESQLVNKGLITDEQFKMIMDQIIRSEITGRNVIGTLLSMFKDPAVTEIFLFEKGIDRSPDALRRLFEAISYSAAPKDSTSSHPTSQYHVAVVYSVDQIDPNNMNQWQQLGKGTELLGSIALLNDRELLRIMQNLSSKALNNAHPIFDNRGNIRYPQNNI